MKEIGVVCATTMYEDTFWCNSWLGKSLVRISDFPFWDICYGNMEGLGAVYSRYLREEYRDRILVFIHDDVRIEDLFFSSKIREALEYFDIVGLAGNQICHLNKPILWHYHTPDETKSGAVAHPYGKGAVVMTSFGYMPRRCVVVDGLLLAVDVSSVLDAGVNFDPRFNFHYYDMDFCLSAHTAGLKIGTWPIWVEHQSPGLRSLDDVNWQNEQQKFIDKWGLNWSFSVAEQLRRGDRKE